MKGSSGGHKGLQSIIDNLGTQDFPRLKLGIGPVPLNCDPKEFVLGKFLNDEKEPIRKIITEACEIVQKTILCKL